MTRLAPLLCLVLIAHFTSAQTPAYRQFGVADGLPSSEVYEVYNDDEGFVWFATDNGLSKFNGTEFQNFHVKDGVSDPVVFGFQKDDEGRVWLRTFSGKISYLENGKFKTYPYNAKLAKFTEGGFLNFHYFADTKELWFCVRNWYGKIDSLGTMHADTIPPSENNHGFNYVRVRDKGLIVMTTSGSTPGEHEETFTIDGKTFYLNPTISVNRISREIHWRGKHYFSVQNSLVEYDGKSIKVVHHASHPIISLTADLNDNLWVGYLNGGVNRFSDQTFQSTWTVDFLTNKSVTCVRETPDGALWFTTLENGVYIIPNQAIQNFHLPVESSIKTVAATKHHVMIGDKANMVWIYDQQTKQPLARPKIIRDAMTIYSDRQDNIWLFGGYLLTVFNKDLDPVKEVEQLNAVDVHERDDGHLIFLGTQRIHQFDTQLNLVNQKRISALYREFVWHDKQYFIAGRIGLNVSDSMFQNIRPVPDFESYKISELLSVNDSTLFVATIGNGFFLLNTRNLKSLHFDETNFLGNNIHAALLLKPYLWLGTEKGLIKTNVDSIIIDKPKFRYINSRSGLDHDIVYNLVATNDDIWAFSQDDFSIIPKSFSRFTDTQPSFYIREVICNDKPVDISAPMAFAANENNISISFGFISFTNDNIRLRYRIKDSEPWTYTDDRILQFASLASGPYRFALQYTTDSHYWNNAFLPLTFEIKLPWYRQWYIYPVLFVFLFAAALIYVRNRQAVYAEKNEFLKIINEHQQKLIQSEISTIERERNRIARELHDGVGTNLSAIKMSVRQLLHQHREPLADDIEDQFQVAIGELKNIIYDLTPPSLERYGLFTAIKNYVNKIGKNIPIAIKIETFGNEINNFELNIIVFRILQELLSNSIKHSQAENIYIHLSSFDDLLNIIYEDDGVGFTYDPVQSGLGLNNIESRIRSLKGTFKFDSGNFGVSYNIDIPLKNT